MLQMLIKRKKGRTHNEDRNLALLLATTAGILNAMALGAFGIFPSHMSGNTSQISSEVSNSDLGDLSFLAAIIIAFVVGSMASRMLVISGIRNNIRTIFSIILLLEGIALAMMSLFEKFYYSHANNREVIVFLGFLMGLHNSTSTQLSNGRVRSTHITGTLTDAGIALGSLLCVSLRRDPSRDLRGHSSQLFTHLVTIVSFLGGGICGLLLFQLFGFNSMIAMGIFLTLVAVLSISATVYQVRRRALSTC
nr:YoaK family protein [uncultured Erwinia sp.]